MINAKFQKGQVMEYYSWMEDVPGKKDLQTRIYTVTELTQEVKTELEKRFSMVWVTGEISNFSIPSSQHYYFTLKDKQSQISAVMFRMQNRTLAFVPASGMRVVGLGRISVYPPRGTYQIIFEYLEPKGIGALQVAFERLKEKLAIEGLFAADRKLPLPYLPEKISIITSPTGAVIHDILNIVERRFPNMPIEIVPVKVQGDGAVNDIVSAIHLLNHRNDTDVIILARGGGSLEDLQAYNSEAVARAIFISAIPIVSAVGHETDFTIADFVADLRAPTPSAAAEQVVPRKAELLRRCSDLESRLTNRFRKYIDQLRINLMGLSNRLVDPKRRIQDVRLKLDDLTERLIRQIKHTVRRRREQLVWRAERLNALSPLAILERGYSITRALPDKALIKDAGIIETGQAVEVLLWKGSLICSVEGLKIDDKTGDL